MKWVLGIVAVHYLGTGVVVAENLFNNSDFELGDAGYVAVRYVRPDTNPKMTYLGAKIDATTAASGKQSYFLSNPYAEQINVYTHEVRLKPNTEYTFSAWMKSSVDDCKVSVTSLMPQSGKGWQNHGQKFAVGKEWKRYSYTFQTDGPDWKRDHHTFLISTCKEVSDPAADLWIDGLQLQEGALTDYAPKSTVEAASMLAKTLYAVTDLNTSANVDTVVTNFSDKAASAQVRVTVADDYDKVKVFTQDYQMELAPRERKTLTAKLPLNRYGAYRVDTEVTSDRKSTSGQWFDFAVVGKIDTSKKVDLSTTFTQGVNWGGLGLVVPPRYGAIEKMAIETRGTDVEEMAEFIAQGGFRIVRDWDGGVGFQWKLLQPEEGKFDFTSSDRMVDLAARHGMYVLPVLQGAFVVMQDNPNSPKTEPSWILKKSEKTENLAEWLRRRQAVRYSVPMEQWKQYLRAVVGHFKGRVTHYEIFNEPNLYMTGEEYLKYLKAAYTDIKSTDPDAKVVGMCTTGDLGGSVMKFFEDCFKNGALDYLDVVSFHPYDAPHLGAVIGADRQIAEGRALVKKFSEKSYPLWNTELYYMGGSTPFPFESGLFRAHHAAWRGITDMGEGMGQSISPYGEAIFKRGLNPHVDMNGWSPLVGGESYVAFNAVARFCEGGKPVQKLKWVRDTVCYIYEKDGQYRAAFWSYGNAKDLKVTLKATDDEVALYSMFGNRVSLKSMPITLTEAPYYLINSGKLSKEAFVEMLKNAVVESERPVQVGAVRLVPMGEGWALAVALGCKSTKSMSGTVGVQGKGIMAIEAKNFSLDAGGEATLLVPVRLSGEKIENAKVKVSANGSIVNFPVEISSVAKILTVGSKIGEPMPVQAKRDDKKAEAISATISGVTDGQSLTLLIAVKDASPSGEAKGRSPWLQDCVELFVDANPYALSVTHAENYHDQVGRLFILPYAPVGAQVQYMERGLSELKSTQVTTRKTGDGYEVEIRLPLTALKLQAPLSKKVLGFEVAIDNAVGAKEAEEQIGWNALGRAHKDRCSFGFIQFE